MGVSEFGEAFGLQVRCDVVGDIAVVGVEGELDAWTVPTFAEALDRAMDLDVATVVVDFRRCTFADLAGLSPLMQSARGPGATRRPVSVANTSRIIDLILEIMGFWTAPG